MWMIAKDRRALTLFHELHCWDDSYGEMGDLGQKWIQEILSIKPNMLEVDASIFLKDLLMFLCWEDYGLSKSTQVAEFIKNQLSLTEQALATKILRDIKHRAEAGFQKYRAMQAANVLMLLNCKESSS